MAILFVQHRDNAPYFSFAKTFVAAQTKDYDQVYSTTWWPLYCNNTVGQHIPSSSVKSLHRAGNIPTFACCLCKPADKLVAEWIIEVILFACKLWFSDQISIFAREFSAKIYKKSNKVIKTDKNTKNIVRLTINPPPQTH